MLYNKVLLRFLVLTLVSMPTLINAQNTGPNSPDHTTFSGVNNSDGVDLVTGDFLYNLHLLSVPSTDGSYPVVLNYKAGVPKDQEASWVGLGWSLTPGAITRSVKGFPDDWKNKEVKDVINYTAGSHENHVLSTEHDFHNYISSGLKDILGYSSPSGYKGRTWRTIEQDSKLASGTIYMNSVANEINANGQQSNMFVSDVSYYTNDDDIDVNNEMYPRYDEYRVSAGGLDGEILPQIKMSGTLLGEGREVAVDGSNNITEDLTYYFDPSLDLTDKTSDQMYFNFVNSHNSYLQIKNGIYSASGTTINDLNFDGGTLDHEIPEQFRDRYDEISNYDATNKRNSAGKHIEWFTNKEIYQETGVYDRGFVETESLMPDDTYSNPRENNNFFDPNGIGAFTITDESGTTYHFSLPVYQFEQIYRDELSGNFYEHRLLDKYAYTWLLTSITGSDYIDKNNDGFVGVGDDGYWLEFEYGKWSDSYIWETIYECEQPYCSGDPNRDGIKWGRKQIYYLDAIKTNTHTAYFVKDIRDDAQSTPKTTNDDITYTGYIGKNLTLHNNVWKKSDGTPFPTTPIGTRYIHDKTHTENISANYTHKTLHLDKIVIVRNEHATMSKIGGFGLSASSGFIEYKEELSNVSGVSGTLSNNTYNRGFSGHYEANIFAVNDLTTTIEDNALTIIEFTHDYSLCVNTPNSSTTTENPNKGKLTLREVTTYGLEDDHFPSYKYSYYTQDNNSYTSALGPWGYNRNPNTWNIKQIETPIGAKTNIKYGLDTYKRYTNSEGLGWIRTNGNRVESIEVDNGDGEILKTIYEYTPTELGNSGKSKVYYKYVSVFNLGSTESEDDYEVKTTYEFDAGGTYTELKINQSEPQLLTDFVHDGFTGDLSVKSTTLHDERSRIGRLLEVTSTNKLGQLLSKTRYNYYDRSALCVGAVQETFSYLKRVTGATDTKWFATSSSKITYPNVIRSIDQITDNSTSTQEFVKYDLNTGIPIKFKSGESYTETTPAYKKSSYGEMGSKADDIANKNMLSQLALSNSYDRNDYVVSASVQKWSEDIKHRVYNTSGYYEDVTSNVWNQHKGYKWSGEAFERGSYKNFVDFNWAFTDAQNSANGWNKTIEVTKLTPDSYTLEAKGINENYAASKLGYEGEKVVASVANSNYSCFGYTGFENATLSGTLYLLDGEFISSQIPTNEIQAHTGEYCMKINSGDGPKFTAKYVDGIDGLVPSTYRASVWIKYDENMSGNITLKVVPTGFSYQTQAESEVTFVYTDCIRVGDWVLLNLDFEIPTTPTITEGDKIEVFVKTSNGAAYIDDFRVQPIDATMVCSVYDKTTGQLIASLNNDNFATFYEYDNLGRVTKVYVESVKYGKKLIKENSYNYARDNE